MASETLPKRAVGVTGLELTEVGLGAATLGNLYREVSHDQARSTVLAALAAGIRHVDTAPYYGFGLSERRIGDAVRGLDDLTISTKVGAILRPDKGCDVSAEREGFRSPMPFGYHLDYSYDGIMRSWDASLQRLGLSRVDILFIHDFGTHGSNNDMMFGQLTRGGGFRALEELRGSGAIRAFGLGVNEWEVYDPSHFVLQQLDYLQYVDFYHDFIRIFHVKDAEFNPTGKMGVYGGYQDWANRAGRFRSLGDGQVNFKSIFSKLAQYDYPGWAVVEWECCLKHPEQGAKEGAAFVKDHIIRVTERAFDDFAGGADVALNRTVLGI